MSGRQNYYQLSYWEERYKQNLCEWYEWLAKPNELAPYFQQHLKAPSKILELGCGSSNFAEKLITLKHEQIICLDFSKQVINTKQRNAKQGIKYIVHDLTKPLPFQPESFDAIIQKNTLDCLFCYEDFPVRVMKVMKQCFRVLKNGGVMLSFSHGKQKLRRFFYRTRFSPFDLTVQDLRPKQVQEESTNKQKKMPHSLQKASNKDQKIQLPNLYMYVLKKGGERHQQGENGDGEEGEGEGEEEEEKEAEQKNGVQIQKDNENENHDEKEESEVNLEEGEKSNKESQEQAQNNVAQNQIKEDKGDQKEENDHQAKETPDSQEQNKGDPTEHQNVNEQEPNHQQYNEKDFQFDEVN